MPFIIALGIALFLAIWLAAGQVWWAALLIAFVAVDVVVIAVVAWRAWATRR